MKKLHTLFAAFLILTTLPACGRQALDCASEKVFCVGLVTDIGKVNDKSFNQSAWEGVQQADKELGATINYIETADPRDRAKNISVFGIANYDIVVTVGFDLSEETAEAAKAYTRMKFIAVDQFQTETVQGVAGLNFPEDQAGFLVGALASMMSKSHKIGAVCGPDSFPAVWRFGQGYKAGAAYIDQLKETTTGVTVTYHPDGDKAFIDPEWGADTAKSMVNQGVDIVFGCGSVTGNGAIIAAAQADAYAIGVDTDQYWTLPDAAPRMLSSAMKLITPGVFDLIKLAKEEKFPSGNFYGKVGYAPFHDLDNEVPADVKDQMQKIDAGLLDGSINTNVPSQKR